MKKRPFLYSLCATALAMSGLVLGSAPASAGLAAPGLTGAASVRTGRPPRWTSSSRPAPSGPSTGTT